MQIKLSTSLSHSIRTPDQLVPALTLRRQAPGRVASGVPFLCHWYDSIRKNPLGASGSRTLDLPLSRRTPYPSGQGSGMSEILVREMGRLPEFPVTLKGVFNSFFSLERETDRQTDKETQTDRQRETDGAGSNLERSVRFPFLVREIRSANRKT